MDVCRRFQIYCMDVGCAGLEFMGSWMIVQEGGGGGGGKEARTGYQTSNIVDMV